MAGAAGVCCGSLEDPAALMKMGLSVILVGHLNFLLGALVHGVVLRHINLHKHARAMDHAISNVMALISGMLGVIVGILAIILSKNMQRKHLKWSLFALSLVSALLTAASTIGLLVSLVRAIVNGGRSLLTHCRFPDAIGYSSVTYQCPFDPTRIYSTTLCLWVPLIVTCFIQLVFSARCFAACISLLGLPCCPNRRRSHYIKAASVERPMREGSRSRYTESPRGVSEHINVEAGSVSTYVEPANLYAEPPRNFNTHPRHNTVPPRQQYPPPRRPLPHRPQSLPASERQALRRPEGDRSDNRRSDNRRSDNRRSDNRRSDNRRSETRGSSRRAQEQPQRLQRGTVERSSIWI